MRTLFCNSFYGAGGIGQHFAQLVEDSRRAGELDRYYAYGLRDGDAEGRVVPRRTFGLLKYTPIRWSPTWKSHVVNEIFDRDVARQIASLNGTPPHALMGFVGKSLHTFRQGAQLGADTLELVAANSHVDNIQALHARAAADSGIRDSWLNDTQRRKTLKEYALADRIYVHSKYVRESFIRAGISESKLVRTVLRPDARFRPPASRPVDDRFRIVYVGRVEMTKGMGVLLDAFEAFDRPNARLTLVGGWSSRAVRQHVEAHVDRDPRITLAPGDPLPVLQQGDVFVHPSYEDGFGYAPVEALACGLPVIVTQDTGMKEYVKPGVNGHIVPTGSVDAVVSALEQITSNPLATTTSLLPDLAASALPSEPSLAAAPSST